MALMILCNIIQMSSNVATKLYYYTEQQKKDYISQMATATLNLVEAKSEEMWSRQTTRRYNSIDTFI